MKYLVVFFVLCFSQSGSLVAQAREIESIRGKFSKIEFLYDTVTGIGHEKGCTRRDPSDVIKVGGTCYVYLPER